MKLQEEIHNLIQAFQTVSTALVSATVTEDKHDRVFIAMLLMPLLPILDGFMDSLTTEMKAEKEKSAEDPLDKLLNKLRAKGPIS